METPRRPSDVLKKAHAARSLDEGFRGITIAAESELKLQAIARKIESGEVETNLEERMMDAFRKDQERFDSATKDGDKQMAADQFVADLNWAAERLNLEGLSPEERERKFFDKFLGMARAKNFLSVDEEMGIRDHVPLDLTMRGREQSYIAVRNMLENEPISEVERESYLDKFFNRSGRDGRP